MCSRKRTEASCMRLALLVTAMFFLSFHGETARLLDGADEFLDELLVRFVRREHDAIEAESTQHNSDTPQSPRSCSERATNHFTRVMIRHGIVCNVLSLQVCIATGNSSHCSHENTVEMGM